MKPKLCTPLPVTASAILEEEDEGDKIMAELQVRDVYILYTYKPHLKIWDFFPPF